MELVDASVAVVDEDRSTLSQRIEDALVAAAIFCRRTTLAPREIDTAMDADRYTFVVDIPPRFQADVLAGRARPIQVNVDATAMSQAGPRRRLPAERHRAGAADLRAARRAALADRGATRGPGQVQSQPDVDLVQRSDADRQQHHACWRSSCPAPR